MTGGGSNPPTKSLFGPRSLRVVIASLGNEYRRDDGAGQVVAARAAEQAPEVHDVGPQVDPLDLLGRWDGADLAIVVDATAPRAHQVRFGSSTSSIAPRPRALPAPTALACPACCAWQGP